MRERENVSLVISLLSPWSFLYVFWTQNGGDKRRPNKARRAQRIQTGNFFFLVQKKQHKFLHCISTSLVILFAWDDIDD